MLERVRQSWKSVSLETKGTVLGIAAAVATLSVTFGATFGVSTVLHDLGDGSRTHVQPSASLIAAGVPTAAENSTVPAQLVRGQMLFTQECASCHGANAQGGFGPDLRQLEMPDAQVATTIQDGIKPGMPSFGRKYGHADVQAMTLYVKSLHK